MQINSIGYQQNFEARVPQRFIDAGNAFHDKNSTLTRARKFRRQVRDVETFGHPQSELIYSKNPSKGTYSLILKNEELAPGESLVICKKDQFRKVLEYFSHLTDGKIKFAEKRLTGEIK